MTREDSKPPVEQDPLPTLRGNNRFNQWFKRLLIIAVIIAVVVYALDKRKVYLSQKAVSKEMSVQIYPNYEFPDGVNKIKVPLIPNNQRFSQENGGWVITPEGSAVRISYKIPIVIEYIDGRKFYREPHKPAWDGVNPNNGIFRLYGNGKDSATIVIKRNVY